MSEFFEQNNYDSPRISSSRPMAETEMSSFLSKTYGWMAFALALSGLAAWFLGHNMDMQMSLLNHYFLLIILEFGLVFGMSFFISKISYQVASLIFVAYSLLNGVTLSVIFLIYSESSIVSVFGVSALTFGIMAFYGHSTHRDLSTVGKYCMFGLIGIILATFVNFIIGLVTGSAIGGLDLIISYVGVIVFIGLTAYDTQKIKAMAMDSDGSESYSKLALIAALNIYLDFINLFIYLLRIMGSRRN